MRRVIEVGLSRERTAAMRARRVLEEFSAGRLEGEELARAKLLVSELVSNAVLHGRGEIVLRASLDENRLLVEVIDQGSGFERVMRENEFERVGGWGLRLVEAEADRWGVHEGTTHVWFELERPGPRLGEDQNPLGSAPD